ncbi:MAG: twin-arginine translocase subunit TatC [Pseudomonadota bacterium]|jgi:sec-independent protein translocase protein TatC|nr:MAG: twin-arginine translocase subunit TatC [Pseudomonadota bacterium]
MSARVDEEEEKLAEGTLISHLLELRDRIVRAMIGVLLLFIPAVIWRNELFSVLVDPLLRELKEGGQPIATGVLSPFIAPIKLAFFTALFVAMPWVLYQAWAFVAPGLYRKEKRFAVPLLVSSIVLFYVGTAFAYFVVFPAAFHFLGTIAPEEIAQMPDINEYVTFALTTFFAFGVAFEIPVVVVLLTLTGLVSVDKLRVARGYVVIGVFVAAAVLTPPDPLSQILMAIPMWLLYEGGVLMARLLGREKKEDA